MTSSTILLVEDNPDDAELAMIAFERNHLSNSVVHVRDGIEALDYLLGTGPYTGEKTPSLPRVVLLDLKLPKISGLEVLRRLRSEERTRFLPVVILTSSHEDQDLVESYELGVNSYVRKPVDFNRFVEAARQLQLYWLLLNDPPPSDGRKAGAK